MSEFNLEVWRLHPKGIRLEKAEKTLHNTANQAGVKFCRPFSSANSQGWWIYPPVDFDVILKNGKFEYQLHDVWTNTEHELVKSLTTEKDKVDINNFCPPEGRSKFTWGSVENNIVQIWTGCIFKTPPGWCLQVRSPINMPNSNYSIMEGIIESDWMQYDIWINISVLKENQLIQFRKDQFPPLAQLVPIRRETCDAPWEISSDLIVNRDNQEGENVFKFWLDYNHKKFEMGGNQYLSKDRKKDATTFHKERKKFVRGYESKRPKLPFVKKKKKIKFKFIGEKNVHRNCPYSGISVCPAQHVSGQNSQ